MPVAVASAAPVMADFDNDEEDDALSTAGFSPLSSSTTPTMIPIPQTGARASISAPQNHIMNPVAAALQGPIRKLQEELMAEKNKRRQAEEINRILRSKILQGRHAWQQEHESRLESEQRLEVS